jgi:hypothetical protein
MLNEYALSESDMACLTRWFDMLGALATSEDFRLAGKLGLIDARLAERAARALRLHETAGGFIERSIE